MSETKKRISVACDACRRKKIRCNGGYPCSNCEQSDEPDCHYKERPQRQHSAPKRPRKSSARANLEVLDNRMLNLENAITNILGQLQHISQKPPIQPLRARVNSLTKHESDDYSDSTELPSESLEEDEPEPVKAAPAPKPPVPSPHQYKRTERNFLHNRKFETYFGTHSFLGIFSEKSLQWMAKQLGEENTHLLRPFSRMPLAIQKRLRLLVLRWIDSRVVLQEEKTILMELPFPEDPAVVFGLLDAYYDRIIQCRILMLTERVRRLFEEYYNVGGHKKRRLKCSELLIMTVALIFCLCFKIDADGLSQEKLIDQRDVPVLIRNLDTDQARKLQEDFLDNAIFYYHRICLMSDGIETIEGILLLIMYVETSWLISKVSFVLSSVAIRYAQEAGLHRAEAYDFYPQEERDRRRKIWWYCHFFDMEIAFRTGKPPMINPLDVSNHFGPDVDITPFSVFLPLNRFPSQILSNHLEQPKTQHYFDFLNADEQLVYHHYFFTLLTRLRSRSYKLLFMASAKIDSFDTLSQTLDELNSEMFELRDYMPDDCKPYFYNHPSFKAPDVRTTKDDSDLAVQLSYFLHLMVINRLPSLVDSDHSDNDQRSVNYRNLSLDSARTILIAVKGFTSRSSLTFYQWLLFFPLSAFLNLAVSVINHPTSPDAPKDIELLISSSNDFFSIDIEAHSRHSESELVSLMIKMILRVTIVIFETKSGNKIFANNEALRKDLESLKDRYPELYRSGGKYLSVLGVLPFTNNQHRTKRKKPKVPETVGQLNGMPPSFLNNNEVQSNQLGISPGVMKGVYDGRSHDSPSSMNLNTGTQASPQTLEASNGPGHGTDLSNDIDDFLPGDDASLFSQMVNFPNFFFDSSLGIDQS